MRNGSLFAASFLVLNLIVHHVCHSSNALPSDIAGKFRHFSECKDEYDVVFVGSSLVERQIVPRVFEEQLRLRGHDLKAFNFGIFGMYFPESDVLLERLLSLEPKRLKWVLVEPHWPSELRCDAKDPLSERGIWWHTPRATYSTCGFVMADEHLRPERLIRLRSHVRQMLTNVLHIGKGLRLPTAVRSLFTRPMAGGEGIWTDQGYQSFEGTYGGKPVPTRRSSFLASKHLYEDVMEKYRQDVLSANPDVDPIAARPLFEGQVARVRAFGVEPLYVTLPPLPYLTTELESLAREGCLPALFSYNDPARFPRFHECEANYDWGHLSDERAIELTRVLANDFADYLEGKR